jgi:hypothetical protein
MPAKKRLVVEEVLEEPAITPEHVNQAQSTTAATLAALQAEPMETVYVPGNLDLSGALHVTINGARFSYPHQAEYQMPASVAALARQRIAGAELTNPKAK